MTRGNISLPLLDQIRIASPCPVKWENMAGDERVRHCSQCDLDVHNFSNMTRAEAEGVLSKLAEGRVCAQFYRRKDGTILTRDCPIGVAAARKKLLMATSRIAAALGLAVLAASAARAAEDRDWGNYGWSMRLRNVAPVQWVAWRVRDAWYRTFPRAMGGMQLGGVISMPPGNPPPQAKGENGSPFGPHGWEYKQ